MNAWVEILDHGDDPARYTIIRGVGGATCNETGQIVFQRRCCNPAKLVYDLRREPGVGLVTPKKVEALLKKVELLQTPPHEPNLFS